MLIIEGPDGVGKTTLAKELQKRLSGFGYIYSHFTRLPDSFDRVWGYVERMSRRVVQDRFHMSELAYTYARGDTTKLDTESYRLVDAHLRQIGGMTILLNADPELVESRWDQTQMYDKERTRKAAIAFNILGKREFQLRDSWIYETDIDIQFFLTKDRPYVTANGVNDIVERYLERQRKVYAIRDRREG